MGGAANAVTVNPGGAFTAATIALAVSGRIVSGPRGGGSGGGAGADGACCAEGTIAAIATRIGIRSRRSKATVVS